MATENDLATEVELLKREVGSMNVIHGRLDMAIEKLTEVSNCINRMLAVHEERISLVPLRLLRTAKRTDFVLVGRQCHGYLLVLQAV